MHDISSLRQGQSLHAESKFELDSTLPSAQEASTSDLKQSRYSDKSSRQYVPPPVDPSRIVPKPNPISDVSKRESEINQIRRRFSLAETSTKAITILAFKLSPTDPDFPFDLDYLDCVLQIPLSYPESGLPTLNVRNKEMERGFQFNIEQGFDSIVKASPKSALLSYINALDRQLEDLLSGNKAETIKFIPNVQKSNDLTGRLVRNPGSAIEEQAKQVPARQTEPSYSSEQRAAAMTRREMEIRQLEARLGRQSLFAKSSDGIAYTLPIEPRHTSDLPVPLQSIKTVRLYVPMLYPLLPCRIALQGVARDAAVNTERAFERKAKESPETTLMGHVNFLAINMHSFALEQMEPDEPSGTILDLGLENLELHDEGVETSDKMAATKSHLMERTHLHMIPRPPEWTSAGAAESDSGTDDTDHQEYTSSEEEMLGAATDAKDGPERGISVNFPNIELHGIELLELTSLSLIAKCSRCKESIDVNNLRHNAASARHETCKKCASILSVGKFVPSIKTDIALLNRENRFPKGIRSYSSFEGWVR